MTLGHENPAEHRGPGESAALPSPRSRGTDNIRVVVFRERAGESILTLSPSVLWYAWLVASTTGSMSAVPFVLGHFGVDANLDNPFWWAWHAVAQGTVLLVLGIGYATWFVARGRGPYLRLDHRSGSIHLPREQLVLQPEEVAGLDLITGWHKYCSDSTSYIYELQLRTTDNRTLLVVNTMCKFSRHARRFAEAARLPYRRVHHPWFGFFGKSKPPVLIESIEPYRR